MKKVIFILTITLIIYSCGNQDASKETTADTSANNNAAATEPAAPASGDMSSNPDYQKGMALITTSDCLTCHAIEEKKIGPSYRDVANKYTNDDQTVTLLAGKVIKGGSGVWGQVAMTPHTTLPIDDAKQMVKYILLLKK